MRASAAVALALAMAAVGPRGVRERPCARGSSTACARWTRSRWWTRARPHRPHHGGERRRRLREQRDRALRIFGRGHGRTLHGALDPRASSRAGAPV